MKQGCKIPGCGKCATTTWAQVPLCADHRWAIEVETINYYQESFWSKKYAELRPLYMKIARQIPWSRVSMGEVLPDGSLCGD